MVLLVDGKKFEAFSEAFAGELVGLKTAVGDIKQVGGAGCLYVSQREFAAVSIEDKFISVIGTDDCTTCLAVVMRHPISGAVSLGHFDSAETNGLALMIQRIRDLSHHYYEQCPIDLHLFGAFLDSRGCSEKVFYGVMKTLQKHPTQLNLVTAMVGSRNTVIRENIPWPILYGVGVDVKSGEVFPACFLDKGPDIPLRHSRLFSGGPDMIEIYDNTAGLLRIGPFHYEPIRSATLILQESDEVILQHFTTSPEVEPSHIVSEIKQTILHILQHPFPEITIFPDNRPRYYRKDPTSTHWILLRDNYRYELNE